MTAPRQRIQNIDIHLTQAADGTWYARIECAGFRGRTGGPTDTGVPWSPEGAALEALEMLVSAEEGYERTADPRDFPNYKGCVDKLCDVYPPKKQGGSSFQLSEIQRVTYSKEGT